jgi:hypothetical protein
MKNKIKSFIGYIFIISLFIFSLKKCSDFSHEKSNLKHLNSDLDAMKKEQKERLYYANKTMQDIFFEKKSNENRIDSLNLLINNLNKNKIIYKIKNNIKTNNFQNLEYLEYLKYLENVEHVEYMEMPKIKDSSFEKIVYIEKFDTIFVDRIIYKNTTNIEVKRKRFFLFNIFRKRN